MTRKKFAVWYHCFTHTGDPPKPHDTANQIIAEQLKALTESGLRDACDELHVGVNGGGMLDLIHQKNLTVHMHGMEWKSENATMIALQEWLPGHEDWLVCYHHVKGASYALHDPLRVRWRRRMQKYVIENWKQCVEDLTVDGWVNVEAVGCHWLTERDGLFAGQFAGLKPNSIFGGNFWWAKGSYLATLPPIKNHPLVKENRFLAELFIGSGPEDPNVIDYFPGWPG